MIAASPPPACCPRSRRGSTSIGPHALVLIPKTQSVERQAGI
jgi:hypothetical protein